MALSDPLSFTIGSVTYSLARVETQGDLTKGLTSTYENDSGVLRLLVTQQITKANRIRTSVRAELKAVVTNPLDSTSDYDTITETHAYDRPAFGFDVDDVKALTAGMKTFLADAMVEKLYGKQS